MSRAEEVRKLRESGMSIDEICERLGAYERNQRHEVVRICRQAGMPMTEDEKRISKEHEASIKTHDNDWADEYIKQRTDGKFIRVSDYIGMDSKITIKCTECGTEKTILFSNFRGKKGIRCPICYEKEREQKREQKELQQKEEEHRKTVEKLHRKRINNCKGNQIYIKFCECGDIIVGKNKRCDKCRAEHQRESLRAHYKRNEIKRDRKISAVMIDKDITLERLYERDKGVCHICGCECDYNDYITREETFIAGNNYPSIDHVKPLAKGGEHSWKNVMLAHRICNSKKKDSWTG